MAMMGGGGGDIDLATAELCCDSVRCSLAFSDLVHPASRLALPLFHFEVVTQVVGDECVSVLCG